MVQTAFDRETVYRRYLAFGSLVKGGAIEPHWLADGSSFWYAEGEPDRRQIYKVDPASGTTEPLFNVDRLRQSLADHLGHQPPYSGIPFETFSFTDGERQITFEVEG